MAYKLHLQCSYLAVLGIIQNTWEQWIVKEKISPVSDIWHGNLHPRKLECSKRRPLNFIVLLFCATLDMELNKFQAENWVTQILKYWGNSNYLHRGGLITEFFKILDPFSKNLPNHYPEFLLFQLKSSEW